MVYEQGNHGISDIRRLGKLVGDKIEITKDVDLQGAQVNIPSGYTLVFQNGVIKNGLLVGNKTKISCKNKAFDHVTVKGTWMVPEISTALFVDLNYENSLRDVMALSSSNIQNTIKILPGNYLVKALKDGGKCLIIPSNTELILDGTITLVPNNYTSYSILYLSGEHIAVSGYGTIKGDKHMHTGSKGEWGAGVDIMNAIDVTVSNITVRDCWGDCIYVGDNSRNVLIKGCTLIHGRRQGISITSANGVTVRKCKISDVGGTDPEYAIDIEPNRGKTVNNILIEDVTVKNCKGGFMANGCASDSRIGTVTITDCNVDADDRPGINMGKCENVTVQRCVVVQQNTARGINCENIQNMEVQNNEVHQYYLRYLGVVKSALRKVGKDRLDPIRVSNCNKKKVEANKYVF